MKFDRFMYMLAPLEDTSDSALRTLCYRHGADVTFSEMTRFESLAKKNENTWAKIAILDDTPAHVQIVGSDEQLLKRFLAHYEPPKAFQGFNLNFGCPNPQLVNNGLGCAMIKRVAKTKKLVQIIKDRGYTCSIKMRLGLNGFEKEKKAYLNLIDGVPADFFIVHARVGSQTYDEPADYSVYPACVKLDKPIIANGDVDSAEKVELVKSLGVSGVMIGRAAVRNPAIFNHLKELPVPDIEKLKEEYLKLANGFDSKFRYRNNVLKRLGISASILPDDSEHVQG